MNTKRDRLREKLARTLEPSALMTAVGLAILKSRGVELPPDGEPGVRLYQSDFDAFWRDATVAQLRQVQEIARGVTREGALH